MSDLRKYKGVVVPMVTPLTKEFEIDETAVKYIVTSFIENGVLSLLLGTTGEVASLSIHQKTKLLDTAVKEINGRMPVITGLYGNSILTITEEGKKFADMGADTLVVFAPGYYPLKDYHALKWFEQLADQLPRPVFLYNIPATTHHSISLDVIEKISHHPNIVGIKDSQPDKDRLNKSLELWANREDFLFLVGCAANSAYGLQKGADGIVPSIGNLFPDLYANMYKAAKKDDFTECMRLQELANKVSKYNQDGRTISEAIPALKSLMSLKGICTPQVMPPMQQADLEKEKANLTEMEKLIQKQVI